MTHVEEQDSTPHALSDLAWETGYKDRQNKSSEVTEFKTPSRQVKGD